MNIVVQPNSTGEFLQTMTHQLEEGFVKLFMVCFAGFLELPKCLRTELTNLLKTCHMTT